MPPTSRYAKAHESLQSPGDARPTALQIVNNEGRENDLQGKVVLITGCLFGIGIEDVYDFPKAELALHDLVDSPRVHLLHLDLNTVDSVYACVEKFKPKSASLNILIENAGVLACPQDRTAEKFEKNFGTNHLAHLLLFYLLKSVLLLSSTSAFQSRVVIVSSNAYRLTSVRFDNLSLEGKYDHWRAYSQQNGKYMDSKLCQKSIRITRTA